MVWCGWLTDCCSKWMSFSHFYRPKELLRTGNTCRAELGRSTFLTRRTRMGNFIRIDALREAGKATKLLRTLLPLSSKTGSSRSGSVTLLMWPLRTGLFDGYPWTPTSQKDVRWADCWLGEELLERGQHRDKAGVLLLPHSNITYQKPYCMIIQNISNSKKFSHSQGLSFL